MKWFVLSFALAAAVVAPLNAQVAPACCSTGVFVERARAGTQKYQDQAVAIADGYQRIGSDFPAMGEHWVNTNLLFDGKLDVDHPEVLTYVTVSGRPRLVGAAYALPLLPGESAPPWPSGDAVWHDHYRSLDDETFLPQHHATESSGFGSPRISMLHAWIWLDNPEGLFVPENWSIPYLRLSLNPPNAAVPAASRAISMAAGGTDFFLKSIETATRLSTSDRKTLQAVFARTETNIRALLSSRDESAALTPSDLEHLSDLWTNMWATINASVSRQTRQRLRGLGGF